MPTAPVTVVIPVFNRRELLGRALRSIAEQLVQPSSIVVVDDGSTDGSAEVAERFGVDVIRQRNAGSSSARNAGLDHASTPWVALLDSDDRWFPDHLDTLFRTSDDTILRSTAALTSDGRLRGSLLSRPLRLTRAEQLLWPENPVVTSGVVFSREDAISVGAFDVTLTYNEDLDLWIRLLGRGNGVVLPRATLQYEVHETQLSVNGDAMHAQTMRLLAAARADGWCSARTCHRVMAREHWDALRAHDSGWGSAGDHARALLRPPLAVGLGELLLRRLRARKLAARSADLTGGNG
jgi:GT2 family glycosyltransferase